MTMTPETKEALEKCIEHWARLAAGAGTAADNIGAKSCALCALYNKIDQEWDDCCINCPVFKKTGHQFCEGTPFDDAHRISEVIVCNENELEYMKDPAFILAAKAELKFLKSLREPTQF